MSNYLGIDELTLQQWEEISIAHRVTCLEMKDHRGGGSKIAVNIWGYLLLYNIQIVVDNNNNTNNNLYSAMQLLVHGALQWSG